VKEEEDIGGMHVDVKEEDVKKEDVAEVSFLDVKKEDVVVLSSDEDAVIDDPYLPSSSRGADDADDAADDAEDAADVSRAGLTRAVKRTSPNWEATKQHEAAKHLEKRARREARKRLEEMGLPIPEEYVRREPSRPGDLPTWHQSYGKWQGKGKCQGKGKWEGKAKAKARGKASGRAKASFHRCLHRHRLHRRCLKR